MRWLSRRDRASAANGTPAAAAKRRRARRRWLRTARRAALIAVLFAVAAGGPAWLWRTGALDNAGADLRRAALGWSADLGLTVQQITLAGRVHASRRGIAAAVGLKRGDAILGFDPAAVRARLVALPWVRDAVVERRLPDAVRVRVIEQQPLVLWQNKGRLMLVDDRGEVITERGLQRFRNLLIVVGDDAPRQARTLIAMLGAEPNLARRVDSATRVGKRRWNLKLKGGITVRLPEKDPHLAWRRLARLERRDGLLAHDIRAVDLRQPDRLILVTPEGARPIRTSVEQNT